jgi:hypothetical protein
MSSMLCPVDHRAMPMMRRTFLAQALAGAGLRLGEKRAAHHGRF